MTTRDVTMSRANHARAAALLLTLLHLALSAAEAEEVFERIDGIALGLDGHLDEDDGVDGRFGGICKVGIVCVCQIDSPVDGSVRRNDGVGCGCGRSTSLDDSECCQPCDHGRGEHGNDTFIHILLHVRFITSLPRGIKTTRSRSPESAGRLKVKLCAKSFQTGGSGN